MSGKIEFRCAHCSARLAVPSEHAGKLIACPRCKKRARVPEASATPAGDFPELPSLGAANQADAPPPPQPSVLPLSSNPATVQPSATHDGSAPARSGATFGRSILGLLAAAAVAGTLGIVWVLIVAFAGFEVGYMAWGVGALVGLTAGAIARNGSFIYCGAASVIAVGGVVFAKLILAVAIMAMVFMVGFVDSIERHTPDGEALIHALADEKLNDGTIGPEDKELAREMTESFYTDTVDLRTEEDAPWDDANFEEDLEARDEFARRMWSEISELDDEQRKALLDRARQRRPDWIGDPYQIQAAVDALAEDPATLSEEGRQEAMAQRAALDNDSERMAAAYEGVSPEEITKRQEEVRNAALGLLRSMSAEERDALVRETMGKHPEWTPFEAAYFAVMDQMRRDGSLAEPLVEYAEKAIESRYQINMEDFDFEQIAEQAADPRNTELRKVVNQRLATMNAEQRDAASDAFRLAHPEYFEADQEALEWRQSVEEIGSDGTFFGSLAVVLQPLDALWVLLGASSAFTIARRQATK